MKVILGILLVFSLCLVALPLQAASFGLSPAIIDCQIAKGESKTFDFTVVGYSGTVDISSESMPVTISPASVNVIVGSKVAVTIKCNSDATDGLYEGKIVFLAKSGNSVMSGIKVKCNLKVGNSSSPIVYKEESSSASTLDNGIVVSPGAPVNVSSLSSSSSNSVVAEEKYNTDYAKGKMLGQEENSFNWLFFAIVIVAGLLFFVLFIIGYRWIQRMRKI